MGVVADVSKKEGDESHVSMERNCRSRVDYTAMPPSFSILDEISMYTYTENIIFSC